MPQSHLVALTVAPGNGDVCVCAGVFVHTCRTRYLLQVVLCRHSWLFIEGLYPLPSSLLRVCLGRWAGSCLQHCTLRHHGSVVIIVLHQLEDVSEVCGPDPSCWHGWAALALHPPGVALRWLLMVLLGHRWDAGHVASLWLFPFLLSHLQSGLVYELGLPDGLSGADSVNSPCCWTPGCCCRSISSIYPGLLSALQLLLTQINVSFLSLYFLQSWHVVTLQSVGAVLSPELRNTFSPRFPGNSRHPPLCICYHDCGSSEPQHLSCVGSAPSPCLPLPFPFLLPPLLPFFPPSFSFLSEKHCCCMCMFQTSFQPY